MCNKMARNLERYSQEVTSNKKNLEYWLSNGTRIAECTKDDRVSSGYLLGQSAYEDKRMVGIFANDHTSACKPSELLLILDIAEWEFIRARLSNTLSSNAWRACLLAQIARQRGEVPRIRKVITETGRSNAIFMEKVS